MKYLILLISCFFGLAANLLGQTCQGSLGDPIVNIDFGRGNTLYNPNNYSDITDYTYTQNQQVEDGQYTIKNSTIGDHPGGWWQTGDHTGGGYMMVVNASFSPGIFYKQTIIGLCPGTTYEFAAWILNLLRGSGGIQPNISFIIQTSDGSEIPFDTGDLQNGDANWHQYGRYFVTPPGSGIVTLIMRNNAPGGGGNDIAIDDITFRACGPLIPTQFEATTDPLIYACEGDNISYKLVSKIGPGYNNPVYQWQQNISGFWTNIENATSSDYQVTMPSAFAGRYSYRVLAAEQGNIGSAFCRIASNDLTIEVGVPPPKEITGQSDVCEGEDIRFTAPEGDSYKWIFPDGSTYGLQTVSFTPARLKNAGHYTVVVKRNNCSVTIGHDVVVYPAVKATVTPDTTICIGHSVQLQAGGGTTYSWSPAIGLSDANVANPIASPVKDTKYTVKVVGANGCLDTISVKVKVIQKPTADAGDDVAVYEGEPFKLNGTVSGKTHYWTPATGLNDATDLQATVTPTDDITYTLHSLAGGDCNTEATDDVFVHVYKKVIIPNTFTPNNDGVNDKWNIVALNTYPTADVQVFDRKGEKVYQSTGYSKPWDGTYNGKPLPAAVYYYKIDLKIGPIRSGWVTIIR